MSKNKILIAVPLTILMLFVALVGSVGATGQAGTTLTATVNATAHLVRTFHWTIDKSVTPDSWNLFRGDSGTSQYTILVTKDEGTLQGYIDGTVCVTNGGAVATENLQINIVMRDGASQNAPVIATMLVDVSGNPTLDPGDPGETGCYNYSIPIPALYAIPGKTLRIDADVTITNHSGHLGTPFGPSPAATTVVPPETLVNDSINVDDTNGGSWEFSASGSVNYDTTLTCDSDEGPNVNTATIVETDQSDNAVVTVSCFALEVKKDASTSFTRTYNWTIDKSADQSTLTLATGEQLLVNYSVAVDATYTDSDWAVSGKIYIHNPAPMAANLTAVSDLVSPDIAANVDCPSLIVPARETLACTYSADLPDASSRTNTATATLQNYDYDYEMNATEDGTTNLSGTADVDFSNATINEVDECINVSDTFGGSLGTVCYSDAPKTFTYSRWIGPYSACGDYTVDNTASFITNDTGVTGSDGWSVAVNVPCAGGCTLTQGYWKTHSSFGPAPYDDTWALLLPSGPNSIFFSSGKTWYQVFWTPPAGNAYYNLAHQYMAAKLNILNGADPAAAQAALDTATTLFNKYTPAQIAVLKGNSSIRKQFIDLASILDNYNNGYIGPGHCSE
jgi:hypothetical protein